MKIKKNVLLITSLIVLLPIVIGLFLWRQLPEQIATHFDFCTVDGLFGSLWLYENKCF